MRLLTTLILALLFFNVSAAFSQNFEKEIIEYLQNEMKQQKIPGLQFAVIQNNRVILSKSLGLANISFSVPVNDSTAFSINSIGKVFTSTAIMQLVERKQIQLEQPILNLIEDIPVNWQKVTIKQLLSHTSGLPDIEDPIDGELVGGKGQDFAWQEVKKLPLQFKPGEEFSYNATNYLLLQKIIEKCTKKSFEEFIWQDQFEVAGIDKLRYGNSFDAIANQSPTYSYYYLDKASGEYVKGNRLIEVYEEFPTMLRADAGVFTTANEMAKWIIALQSNKFLKDKESIVQMWNPVKLNNNDYGGFDDLLNAYAFGWPVIAREKHPGIAAIGGGRASVIVYPKDDLSIILFTNLTGFSPHEIIENISEYYFQK